MRHPLYINDTVSYIRDLVTSTDRLSINRTVYHDVKISLGLLETTIVSFIIRDNLKTQMIRGIIQ